MMKTESLAHVQEELLPLTLLLKRIKKIETSGTVHEYETAQGVRTTALIRYCGQMITDEDSIKAAAMRLLAEIDDTLIYGDCNASGHRQFDGLEYLTDNHWIDELKREEFFERFERDKHKHGLRLFQASRPQTILEGDLPPTGRLYAIGHDALRWAQLLPMTKIPLVSMREGKVTIPLDAASPPITFEHDDSRVMERGCIVLYGTMYIHDSDAIFAQDIPSHG